MFSNACNAALNFCTAICYVCMHVANVNCLDTYSSGARRWGLNWRERGILLHIIMIRQREMCRATLLIWGTHIYERLNGSEYNEYNTYNWELNSGHCCGLAFIKFQRLHQKKVIWELGKLATRLHLFNVSTYLESTYLGVKTSQTIMSATITTARIL